MIRRGAGDAVELSLPADPALALTARMFAGALAGHLGGGSTEDLKLAFSELLASAVDAGTDVVTFRVDLQRHEIVVVGASVRSGANEEIEEHERFARSHRADLMTALFPRLRTEGAELVLPLPLDRGE